MKKRLLSILLCLCMAACMLPTVAFAAGAENDKAIQLVDSGTAANISGGQNDNIYFGTWDEEPIKWRVLDDQTNTGESGLFLLSDALLGTGWHGDVCFDNSGNTSNAWQSSTAKTWCNNFYGSSFSNGEQGAVLATTKSDGALSTGGISFAASENILNGDKVFFLSAEEAENSAYGFTDDNARIANYGNSAGVWWLRSPYAIFTTYAGVVFGDGPVYAYVVSGVWAARPAFNLNLNSVLFASAAVGGKPDGGLTPISEYTGNEWKLTLKDSNRNFAVTETTVSGDPGDTVTLHYTGATAGINNEYISVILADNSGAQYYGRVAQPTAESGTVEIKIPSDIAPGDYTLKVFNEQYNGDYNTDYASNFTDIALTVENQPDEQFTLTPGGTYYFDLSAMGIPGTVNDALPDNTLHYVPFTYAGTVNAYKLTTERATTEEYAQREKYPHSLFIADYNVTFNVDWNQLNEKQMIFGTPYTSYGVNYTMRAPSAGSQSNNGKDDSSTRGIPKSNEWDAILDKANQDWKDNISGYIKNWSGKYSFGQDNYAASYRAYRGYFSARFWGWSLASTRHPDLGFRPVLEVLNPDTLDSDGLKVVTLDLGGGKLGGSSDAIHIIVKTGSKFTAPASDGMTRPDGNTGSFFMWLGSDGKLYAPGAIVPAEVTKLTVQWTAPTYAVTLNTNGGTIADGKDVTGYTYGVGATLPTDVTRTGYTFKGWYDNEGLTGDPVTAIGNTETGNKEYWAKWEINQYTITFDTAGGSEIAPITQDYGTPITAPAAPIRTGYTFAGWSPALPATMPAENMTITAQWTVNQYTITFDTAGGSAIAPITQDYGTAITAPADPTREGYTFVGWNPEIPATMPAENLTITAQWTINQYTITFDTAGGSEIAPITQDYGTPITAPAAPIRTGYTFAGWSPALPATMPAENMTITAQWTVNQYTITFDTAGGSAIAPITQDYGTAITAPADPTRNGYTFVGWSPALPAAMPAENMTVTAQWRVNRYTITYDLDRGTADDNPTGYTVETETFTLKNPTRPGYIFSGWSGTGLTGEDNLTVTIPKGSTGNRSYTAHWRYNGGYRYYTIKATAGAGGSISPSGNVSVREGSDRTFTITPDKGYAVSNVKIDGKSIGAVRSYTFENVRHAHTIEVSFMKAGGNPQTGVFVDVATGSYYEDAVDWAVENGITTGVSANRFDPNGVCTRAQAVTFLWRAAGSPKPETRTMPFTDVPAGSYYYDAVLWAVENGITKGTSDTRFSPDDTCTRAQIVTFLWRSEKSPAAGSRNPFADVKSTAYYADAVLWAVREDITKGTTSTTFSPNADCTRAQIVTFLWRCKK